MASFRSYLNNNAPFLNARNEYQRLGGLASDARRRWESAKETDPNYDQILAAYRSAQENADKAKKNMDDAEDRAEAAFNKEKEKKDLERNKKKDAPILAQIETVEDEILKYENAGLAIPADKSQKLKDLQSRLSTQPKEIKEDLTQGKSTTEYMGGYSGIPGKPTTPTQLSFEEFIKGVDSNPKLLAKVRADLGIKSTDPKLDIATYQALARKEKDIETLAGIRGPIDRLTYYAETKGTGTGEAGPSVSKAASVYTDDQARAFITDTFRKYLNTEPTPNEIIKLTKKLQNAQRKNPSVTKYRTLGGVREQITTPGLDEAQFILDIIQKDPRYDKKQQERLLDNKAVLSATAKANGLDLDANFGNQVNDFLNRIKNGEKIENIQNLIRQQGRLFLPENIRNAVDPSVDLSSALGIYVNDYAKTFGIPADQVDINEIIPLAITDKGFAPVSDFKRAKRKLAKWATTDEAINEAYQAVGQVFNNWGIMEI